MFGKWRSIKILSFFVLTVLLWANCMSEEKGDTQPFSIKVSQVSNPDTATFAGGCFWCVEVPFEKYHGINLTKKGIQVAEGIRQKHGILLEFFEILGVGYETANQDAEGIEHHLNPKTIKQLRKFITFLKSNPKILENFKNL